MIEYATRTLSRAELLEGLRQFGELISADGMVSVELSFGWDSNLTIEQMWKPQDVSPHDLVAEVLRAESEGTVVVGEGDIFIATPNIQLQLCHESDLHVRGDSQAVTAIVENWRQLGNSPYEVRPGVFRSQAGTRGTEAGDA